MQIKLIRWDTRMFLNRRASHREKLWEKRTIQVARRQTIINLSIGVTCVLRYKNENETVGDGWHLTVAGSDRIIANYFPYFTIDTSTTTSEERTTVIFMANWYSLSKWNFS